VFFFTLAFEAEGTAEVPPIEERAHG